MDLRCKNYRSPAMRQRGQVSGLRKAYLFPSSQFWARSWMRMRAASSASVCAEPRCLTMRYFPPDLSTICTAVAPEAVRTLRKNGDTAPFYRPI